MPGGGTLHSEGWDRAFTASILSIIQTSEDSDQETSPGTNRDYRTCDHGYVALCPELDIASEGASIEETPNLIEALTLLSKRPPRPRSPGAFTAKFS
jgi:hypothetical protein